MTIKGNVLYEREDIFCVNMLLFEIMIFTENDLTVVSSYFFFPYWLLQQNETTYNQWACDLHHKRPRAI